MKNATIYKKFFIILILFHTTVPIHCSSKNYFANLQRNKNTEHQFATIVTTIAFCGLSSYALYLIAQNYMHYWDYTNKKSTTQNLNFLLNSHDHASELQDLIDYLHDPNKNAKTTEKHSNGFLFTGETGELFIQALKNNLNSHCFSINLYDFWGNYTIGPNGAKNLHESATRVSRFFRHIKRSQGPYLIVFRNFEYLDPQLINTENDQIKRIYQEEIIAIEDQLIKEINNLRKEKHIFVLAAIASDVSQIPLELKHLFQNHLDNWYDTPIRAQIIKILFEPIISYTDITETDLACRTSHLSERKLLLLREQIINAIALSSDKIKVKAASEVIDNFNHGPIDNDTNHDPELTAYHEAGHALIIIDLKTKYILDNVSILPRRGHLGLTKRIPIKNTNHTIQECLDEICMSLAGYAAEELFLSEKTLWEESSDYQDAYKLANAIAHQLKTNDACKIMDQEYMRAIKLLKKNQKKLTTLAKALLEHKVLMADEIYTLLEKEA